MALRAVNAEFAVFVSGVVAATIAYAYARWINHNPDAATTEAVILFAAVCYSVLFVAVRKWIIRQGQP